MSEHTALPQPPPPVVPPEGWHVVHLFFRIERGMWDALSGEDHLKAKTEFSRLVQDIRATDRTQLLTFSVVSPKADLALMLLTPDLQTADAFSKKLGLALGPDILTPVYSYLSMTEWTEYFTTEEEYTARMVQEKSLTPGTPEMEAELVTYRQHMAKYRQDRTQPNMPDWPVFCFYPMSKRRGEVNNWYALPQAERKTLMAGHAITGRRYSGKVRQLITGSTGLDEHEWGVTLFSHNTADIKSIVYEMRFDEVSTRFAEFGDFYIGLQLPLDELFRRLLL
ncbi:MAG: hydrogen peroxide-dependent heme synthase [Verrucomicrobiota bacterium]